MGGTKRLLEEEAAKQGTDDISQPSVFQAAQRRLDVKRRQYFLERLCHLTVRETWAEKNVASILLAMTNEEIKETFGPILHDLIQENREIDHFYIVPEPVLTRKAIMDKAVKKAGTTCSRCECEDDEAIDLESLDRLLQDMENSPTRQEMWERHQEMLMEERKLLELAEKGGQDTEATIEEELSENKRN